MATTDPFRDVFTDLFGSGETPPPQPSGAILHPRTLGSGINTAAVYGRGGRQLLIPLGGTTGPNTRVAELGYTRARNDAGTGYVILNTDQANVPLPDLEKVHTWAHELVFFRDNQRVWEGPIRTKTWTRGQVRLDAWDVAGWLGRRRIRRRRKTTVEHPVVDEMWLSLQRALHPTQLPAADPNVTPYAHRYHATGEATITRDVAANSGYYLDDIKSMCAQGGNMAVVGRSIIMWPDQMVIGRVADPLDLDAYVVGDLTVVESGDDLWTITTAVNSDGKTNVRTARNADVGAVTGLSTFYGLHDRYVDGGDVKKRHALGQVARHAQNHTYPAPLLVEVANGATLIPDTPLTFDTLVPGVVVPTSTLVTGARLTQPMQLGSVSVKADGGGEAVTVDLLNPAADVLDVGA